MSNKITKGGLVGLLTGVSLGMIFPPLGVALVLGGAVGGAVLGYKLEEEDAEERREALAEEQRPGLPEPGDAHNADRLLDEFEAWDRRLAGETGTPGGVPALAPGSSPPNPAPTLPATAAPQKRLDQRSASPTPAARPSTERAPAERPVRPVRLPRIQGNLYEQVAAAEALLHEGRFLEAIDRFRGLKEALLKATSGAGPSDRQRVVDGLRQALHRLAGILIENDSPAEAEELLKEALDLAPGNLETTLHLARLQMMLDQPSAAEPYLLEAIEQHPGDPEPYRLLGDLYVESGRLEDARTLFREAIDQLDDTGLAVEMLERLSGLHPEDPAPLLDLGRAHAAEGNWEEAARAYRQALVRGPDSLYARRRLGAILLRLNKTDEGAALLEADEDRDADLDAVAELAHHYAVTQDARAQPLLQQLREIDRRLAAMDPADRRAELRRRGLEGDQVDALYAPLRVRMLLDFSQMAVRTGAAEEAAAAASEAIGYGGSHLGQPAVDLAAALAVEFERRGDAASAAKWKAETTRLGGSLDRLQQERDTYEEFLRRFRYTPRDLIAEGGMARVYRAIDTRTNRVVAVKRMHDRFCMDPQAVAYFYREVRALEELSRPYPHPNIVEFIASGITETRFVFAMEFVEGPSLRQLLEKGQEWSLDEICRLGEGICEGLDRAHNSVRSIIHRDLKPENVLLDDGVTPKLTDFGICRVSSLLSAGRHYQGSARSFVGTSLYSAPEQYPDPYSGQVPPIDARADIYSLGCILYEMLTTQPPFVAADPGVIGLMHQRRPVPETNAVQDLPPPSERNPLALARFDPDVRNALDTLVMRCLEQRPARRYRTARDLQTAVRKLRE